MLDFLKDLKAQKTTEYDNFSAKNICTLHGLVFVMNTQKYVTLVRSEPQNDVSEEVTLQNPGPEVIKLHAQLS